MTALTDEQRELIDGLAESISRLCHRAIARRLEQFFEVIGDELTGVPPVSSSRLNSRLDATAEKSYADCHPMNKPGNGK